MSETATTEVTTGRAAIERALLDVTRQVLAHGRATGDDIWTARVCGGLNVTRQIADNPDLVAASPLREPHLG